MSWYEDPRDYYEEPVEEEMEPDYIDIFPPESEDGLTLWESLELAEASTPRNFMTAEDYDGYLECKGEQDAERAAERFWEEGGGRSWFDHWEESLIDSGLISRRW